MRRALMAAALLIAAILVQLTIINGLRLPGGGVPDLVLVVVAALALASGPVPGAVAGFAAGLCLDLAPPVSGVIGVYALVFVIIGWTCGRLRPVLARSALLPIVIVALACAIGEALVAGLGLALGSATASWAALRQLLPAAVSYDVAISPFVLYGVLLAGAWLADAIAGRPAPGPGPAAARAAAYSTGSYGSAAAGEAALAARRGLAGSGAPGGAGAVLPGFGGWLVGPPRSRRERRAQARRTPKLRPGAGHPGDGWIGSSAAARGGLAVPGPSFRGSGRLGGRAFRGPPFLPGPGGGLLGGIIPTGEPLRGQAFRGRVVSGLSGGPRWSGGGAARLRSGVGGSAFSAARGGPGPGARLDGSALRGRGRPRRRPAPAFGGRSLRSRFRGAVHPGKSLSRGALARLGRRRSRRSGGFRPSGSPAGSALARPAAAATGPGPAAPIRMHTGRMHAGRMHAGRMHAGRMHTGRISASRPGAAGRGRRRDGVIGGGALTRPGRPAARAAAPRFRIRTGPAAGRRRPATPRFRARPLAGARPRGGKLPRFGYHRWRVLTLLTRRHGSRRQVWRINSRWTGGAE